MSDWFILCQIGFPENLSVFIAIGLSVGVMQD
jgi:hypothetical protein